jgi:hypothetical protein
MAALLDAAMVAVGGVAAGLGHPCGRIGEKVDDILMQDRPVGLQREQTFAAARDDPLGDVSLGHHGVDGDERAGQLQSVEQQRNGHHRERQLYVDSGRPFRVESRCGAVALG